MGINQIPKKLAAARDRVSEISEVTRWWVNAQSIEQLREAAEYLRLCNQVNCGFRNYWLKDGLLRTVEDRLRDIALASPPPKSEKGPTR